MAGQSRQACALRFTLPLDALENSPRCSKLDASREGRASAELPQVFGTGTDAQLGAMESEAGGIQANFFVMEDIVWDKIRLVLG